MVMREQQNFTINLTHYNNCGIPFMLYVTLQLLYENKFSMLDHESKLILIESSEIIEDALERKYLLIENTSIQLSELGKALFNSNLVGTWIEEWRSLWPKGKKDEKYYWKGSKSGCLSKMLKLVKTTKASKEQIFEATKRYIRRFSPTYQGMRIAHYFIEKDNISDLITELENLGEPECQSRIIGK